MKFCKGKVDKYGEDILSISKIIVNDSVDVLEVEVNEQPK